MIKLYTDAATKGNPGLSSAGILIISQGQQQQFHFTLPVGTNHEAEFAAVIKGFQCLHQRYPTNQTVILYADSQIVIDSLEKKYAKHYQTQVDTIIKLESLYPLVLHQWIPDRENLGAHQLAWQGLRSAQKDADNHGIISNHTVK